MTLTKALRISLVAWGEKHVRLAKQLCLPSLLDDEVSVKLDVFTDLQDEFDFPTTKISNNPDRKHKLVSDCHRQSISTGDPVVIACPDMIFGAGTLKALVRQIELGKKLVVSPSPRLHRPDVAPLLNKGMSNRELCKVALKHLHPGTDLMMWEGEVFTDNPSQIYWLRDGDLIARCFHMHPLLIWMDRRGRFTGTVDDDCVDLFTTSETRVIDDSDQIACFELSPTGYEWQKPVRKESIDTWVQRKTNRMHKWFFKHECHLHTGVRQQVELPQELKCYG